MLKQELILKLVRFGVVGGVSALTFMALTAVFAHLWGKQLGFLAAYPFSVLVHFSLNKWWTFASHERVSAKQIRNYVLLAAFNFGLQWAVFTAVTNFTSLPAAMATAISIGVQAIVSFIGMEMHVFSARRNATAKQSAPAPIGNE